MSGELNLEEAKEKSFYEDWHLAKRQLTWFKRNDKITWLPLEKIPDFVIKLYQNEQGDKSTSRKIVRLED